MVQLINSSFGLRRTSQISAKKLFPPLDGRELQRRERSIRGHHQSILSPRSPFALGNQAGNIFRRATTTPHRLGRSEPNNSDDVARPHLTLHKSLDFFIRLTTQFPLVITLVALVLCVLPASAVVLALYLVITVLLAVPAFLVCCFGAAQKEFVPTVRISEEQMHPDIYSEWKMMQWNPPEFARAPGGPASNVAVSHVRLGGRAAFMGKVGEDEFGEELVYMMNKERVQTRGVVFDEDKKTGIAKMRLIFVDGKMVAETVEQAAEDSLVSAELDLAVLKEARMFHFNSEVLLTSMHSTLFEAISWAKKFGGRIFFDLNLPLPLWKSRDETKKLIKKAWEQADIIEVSKQELEFLLDEEHHERRRNYKPQYYAENFEQTKNRRDYYHYTREEVLPLWHEKLKFLFVTDGTLRIHYYSDSFDGTVIGTEDVLITPFTCDRTGSGDAVVAGIMRKLTTKPEMFEDRDVLERELRFAIAAGIISQWTIGAVRGFPTESATQNLKEQVYVPSLW